MTSSDAGATSSSITSPTAPSPMPTLSPAPSLTLSPVSTTRDNLNHRPFSYDLLSHLIQHGAVGGVAGGDFHGHDLALLVDHEVQLEAEKPPHAGLAARGQAIEDLVTVDAA